MEAYIDDIGQDELQWHSGVFAKHDGPDLSTAEFNAELECVREKLRQRLILNVEDRPDLYDKIVPPAQEERYGMISQEIVERGVVKYDY